MKTKNTNAADNPQTIPIEANRSKLAGWLPASSANHRYALHIRPTPTPAVISLARNEPDDLKCSTAAMLATHSAMKAA